jgi:hypothetical protein
VQSLIIAKDSQSLLKHALLGFVVLFCGAALSQTPASNLPDSDLSYPKRRAGLWQIRVLGLDQAGMPPTMFCVGEETDNSKHQLDRKAAVIGSCSLGSFAKADGGWIAETICKDSKTTVKSQAVLTGDLTTQYRVDTVISYLPATSNSKKPEPENLLARYLGACPTNSKAGDLTVIGMGTLNLTDGTFRAERVSRVKKRTKKQR